MNQKIVLEILGWFFTQGQQIRKYGSETYWQNAEMLRDTLHTYYRRQNLYRAFCVSEALSGVIMVALFAHHFASLVPNQTADNVLAWSGVTFIGSALLEWIAKPKVPTGELAERLRLAKDWNLFRKKLIQSSIVTRLIEMLSWMDIKSIEDDIALNDMSKHRTAVRTAVNEALVQLSLGVISAESVVRDARMAKCLRDRLDTLRAQFYTQGLTRFVSVGTIIKEGEQHLRSHGKQQKSVTAV